MDDLDARATWARYAHLVDRRPPLGIACLSAGDQVTAARFDRRRLANHALVLVSEGAGEYRQTAPFSTVHRVVAPAVIWVFPGVEHGYGPIGPPWREQWIEFGGPGVDAFDRLGLLSRSRPVRAVPAVPFEFDSLFLDLRDALGEVGPAGPLRASVLVSQALLHLAAVLDLDNRPAEAVLDDVTTSFTEVLTITERARRLGLSLDQFQRRIAEATGSTPTEVVIGLRLARSQELLAETDRSVAAVAQAVGYDDPAYFSRLFSRRVGMPPTEFRRQQSRRS